MFNHKGLSVMELRKLIRRFRGSCAVAELGLRQVKMLAFVPGTYEREYKDRELWIRERIVIHRISATAEMYRIRKVICKYASENKKTLYRPANEEWLAAFNSSSSQLYEVHGNRSCAFIPEEGLLLIGDLGYFKIAVSPYLIF